MMQNCSISIEISELGQEHRPGVKAAKSGALAVCSSKKGLQMTWHLFGQLISRAKQDQVCPRC